LEIFIGNGPIDFVGIPKTLAPTGEVDAEQRVFCRTIAGRQAKQHAAA
jgi:hypothetical protein